MKTANPANSAKVRRPRLPLRVRRSFVRPSSGPAAVITAGFTARRV